jgi:hypothetical protein
MKFYEPIRAFWEELEESKCPNGADDTTFAQYLDEKNIRETEWLLKIGVLLGNSAPFLDDHEMPIV